MNKLKMYSTEYNALLRRWAELCDKRDDDGLRRSERAELFRVNRQLGALEYPQGDEGKEK